MKQFGSSAVFGSKLQDANLKTGGLKNDTFTRSQ